MIMIKRMASALAVTTCGLLIALGAGRNIISSDVKGDISESFSGGAGGEKKVSESKTVKPQEQEAGTDLNLTEKEGSSEGIVGGVPSAGAARVAVVDVKEAAKAAESSDELEGLSADAGEEKKESASLTFSEMKDLSVKETGDAPKSDSAESSDETEDGEDKDSAEKSSTDTENTDNSETESQENGTDSDQETGEDTEASGDTEEPEEGNTEEESEGSDETGNTDDPENTDDSENSEDSEEGLQENSEDAEKEDQSSDADEEDPDGSGETDEESSEDDRDSIPGYDHLGIIDIDGYVNVRSDKKPGAEIVGQMQPNCACEILDVEQDWVHIRSGKIEGYIKTAYLLTGKDALKQAKKVKGKTAKVNADELNIRSDRSADSEIVGIVNDGAELSVDEDAQKELLEKASEEDGDDETAGEENPEVNEPEEDGDSDWIPVIYDGDKKGFVSGKYVTVDGGLPTAVSPEDAVTVYQRPDLTPDYSVKTETPSGYTGSVTSPYSGYAPYTDIVQFATQFVGCPYVWGGESLSNGCDCSGFVMKIYERYGISLPHSSYEQSSYGTPVDPSMAQAGDLVFYDHGSGRVNHVGMYIGNGQIVHASNARDGIKISEMFYSNPVGVRRLM